MHSLPRLTSQSINCHNSNNSDSLTGRRFHLRENVLYRIHKQALSEYLKSGVIDQKIVQLNLLKMSKLNSQDLSILKDDYTQPYSSRFEKEQAKIYFLKQIQFKQIKIRTQRNTKNINFNEKNQIELSLEEIDFMSVEEQLKQCLRSKINTSKVFNGTYMIDPTINDLKKVNLQGKRQLHNLLNIEPKKKLQKKPSMLQRQSSILNPLHCRKPSIQSMEVEDVTEYMSSKILESKANIDQLVERFKLKYQKNNNTSSSQSKIEIAKPYIHFFRINLLILPQQTHLMKFLRNSHTLTQHIEILDIKNNCSNQEIKSIVINVVVQNGARKDLLTKNGKSVQQLSQLYQNQEIIEILERLKYYK